MIWRNAGCCTGKSSRTSRPGRCTPSLHLDGASFPYWMPCAIGAQVFWTGWISSPHVTQKNSKKLPGEYNNWKNSHINKKVHSNHLKKSQKNHQTANGNQFASQQFPKHCVEQAIPQTEQRKEKSKTHDVSL